MVYTLSYFKAPRDIGYLPKIRIAAGEYYMFQFFTMNDVISQITNLTTFLPIILFLTLWIAFPVWLSLRRSQGLIKIEKTDREGRREQRGMYFELGIFFFAIPFTTFFLFIVMNMLLLGFYNDPNVRLQRSLEAAFMLMAIAMFLYIYAAERKIYMEMIRKREGAGESEDNAESGS